MKREFSGFNFEWVAVIDPEKDADKKVREFIPDLPPAPTLKRQSDSHVLKGPFCRFSIPTGFPHPGVYAITVNSDVAYINECQNLSERFNALGYGIIFPQNAFFSDKLTKCFVNRLILENVRADKTVELWFLRNLRERKDIKAQLITRYHPDWNEQLEKLSA